MRTKLICPDCGERNYTVKQFCQKCKGSLNQAEVNIAKSKADNVESRLITMIQSI